MTVCSNCQTPQGPFIRRNSPGLAVCGGIPKVLPEGVTKDQYYIKVVKACNQRRAKIDKGNETNG